MLASHSHALVRTSLGNLSAFMQALQTGYAVYLNLRHRKRGHIFQGPFKDRLVQEDLYLLKLSRYIHLNPVKTRRHRDEPLREAVAALRAYLWSSYRGYVRLEKRREWIEYAALEAQVAAWCGKRRGAYRKYVESGLVETDEELAEALRPGSWAVGAREFVEEVRSRYRKESERGVRRAEDVSGRHEVDPVPAPLVLEALLHELDLGEAELRQRRGGGLYRGLAARLLVKHSAMRQREVAHLLGVGTGAAISIRIREAEKALEADPSLRRKIQRAGKRLESAARL